MNLPDGVEICGEKYVYTNTGDEVVDAETLVKLVEVLRKALKEMSESWWAEVGKRLDDLSIVIASSPDPAYRERMKREYDRVHDKESQRIIKLTCLVEDGNE
jgi:hypothetical protein